MKVSEVIYDFYIFFVESDVNGGHTTIYVSVQSYLSKLSDEESLKTKLKGHLMMKPCQPNCSKLPPHPTRPPNTHPTNL
jgi:hypothetical protein